MPPRAYWKGHVRLSLVSFPVQLIPAVDTRENVTFHRIHEETGQRVRYQPIVPDHGPVERDEIVKGYEYEKGRFVVVEDEELEKLKLDSTHTYDIVQFVDYHEVDAVFYDKPYFMLPDGGLAGDAFRVVRDALREMRKVALGQIVLSTRERIAAVRPCGRGMVLETLRYDEEVREKSKYFSEIPEGNAEGEQLELAKQLIKMKSSPFEPEKFKDHYQAALRQLIAEKLKDRKPAGGEAGRMDEAPKVIDLMEALKRSVKADTSKDQAPTKPKAATGKSGSTRAPSPTAEKKPARTGGSSRTKKSA